MRKILLPAAIGVIVAFGIWEGIWSDRWSWSHEPERAADKLSSVPLNLGDWVGQDREMDPRVVALAEMTGYLLRSYTHRISGQTLEVLLVCGKPGPTSLHPPDVCYQGAGYATDKQELHPVKVPSLDKPAEFRVGRFMRNGPTPDPLLIYWAWCANGTWSAPANPRWTFGSSHFLYKLYVIRTLSRPDEPLEGNPTDTFLIAFLPQLQKTLFPSGELSAAALFLAPLCRGEKEDGSTLSAWRWS